MKSDRLLSITMLLVNHGSVSAPELARRFEVSVRTIYRDMEALGAAGIPVVAETGRSGGFSIMENYRIDRSLIKPDELSHVISGLQGLSTVVGDRAISDSLEKFRNLQASAGSTPRLELHMELAPSGRVSEIIASIRQAASLGRLLHITYSDANTVATERVVEPYAIVYQWSAWYLFCFCRLRNAYRNLKLSRIQAAVQSPERFCSRNPDMSARPWNHDWESKQFESTILKFPPHAVFKVREHFDDHQIVCQTDGSFLVHLRMPIDDWVVSWLCGFGSELVVLSPQGLRDRMRNFAREMLQNYEP